MNDVEVSQEAATRNNNFNCSYASNGLSGHETCARILKLISQCTHTLPVTNGRNYTDFTAEPTRDSVK